MSKAVDSAISTLNSLQIGELEQIVGRLDEVRAILEGMLEDGVILDTLDDARSAISQGDLPRFRRRVQHVVSRLGHLR